MTFEKTQVQGQEELRKAQQLSLNRTRPPTEISGYEAQRFLGAGAYGEVWVALDRNTGRRVAIKFYTHRGGLDWSLLSREVEKLVFLSADRYVVQLLEVGWDAEPPYYVMEYVEQGSLEDRLQSGSPIGVAEAVVLFREIAIGLEHAHGKGVLHCDLKPANVLLDQDSRPRLADFGQSRLSDEQSPSLGTLFYMAPEQADLRAVPDARWDVYALGAILYAMLTGRPPHCSEMVIVEIEAADDLEARLATYRRHLNEAVTPSAHREISGVDRGLMEIVDRCLEVDPARRYPNVPAVLESLQDRETRRARWPLVVLGMFGPVLLLLVMGLAAWRAQSTILVKTEGKLTSQALESNRFAAQYVARDVAHELDRRFREVERVAHDEQFQETLQATLTDGELQEIRAQLSQPGRDNQSQESLDLRKKLINHPARKALQQYLEGLQEDPDLPVVASWFVNDYAGLQIGRAPQKAGLRSNTIGRNYAWRTYFHGGSLDHKPTWRSEQREHLHETKLSPVFQSQATNAWIIAVSTPVHREDPSEAFIGVLALSVAVGKIVELQGRKDQFAVLVDWREGVNKGRILQHPLFDELLRGGKNGGKLPDRYEDYRVPIQDFSGRSSIATVGYHDPLAADEQGQDYLGEWLTETELVKLRGKESDLLVIVQESQNRAIGQTLGQLRSSLFSIGLTTLGIVAVVLTVLWGFVARGLAGQRRRRKGSGGVGRSVGTIETVPML